LHHLIDCKSTKAAAEGAWNSGKHDGHERSLWGVGKTWCSRCYLLDGESTIENGCSGDGNTMHAFGGPPHSPSFAHAGIPNIIDATFRA